jgi:hypothetical protein
MKIQFRTARRKFNSRYLFSVNCNNKYANTLVFCCCVVDSKFWIFKNDTIKRHLNQCYISDESVFNNSLIHVEKLSSELLRMYSSISLFSLSHCSTPISLLIQQQLFYRKKREMRLCKMKFTYPENNIFTFLYNGRRIIEKTSVLKLIDEREHIIQDNEHEHEHYLEHEHTCDNYIYVGNEESHDAYCENDSDFFWFNIRGSDMFFVIPTHVLIKHGNVARFGEIISSRNLFINTDSLKWLNEYAFNYQIDHKNRLIDLLMFKMF